MSLSATIIKAAGRSGSNLVESGASLLLGPWLSRGLRSLAAAHQGPGRVAGPRCAVSFDVDFREDVLALERLLIHLGALSLKASFAVVGDWVREYPREHLALVEAGHEIVNHTLSHPDNEELDPHRHFHLLPPEVLEEQVRSGHELIAETLGVRPRGFRAPHFGHQHTEAVYPILRDLGYLYSSSTLAPPLALLWLAPSRGRRPLGVSGDGLPPPPLLLLRHLALHPQTAQPPPARRPASRSGADGPGGPGAGVAPGLLLRPPGRGTKGRGKGRVPKGPGASGRFGAEPDHLRRLGR